MSNSPERQKNVGPTLWASKHSGCCVLTPLTPYSPFPFPFLNPPPPPPPHPPSPPSRHGLQRVCHARGSGHDDRGGEGGGGGCIDCWACFTSKRSYKHTRAVECSEGQKSPAECSPVELYAHLVVLLLGSSPTLLPSYSQGLPAVWKRHQEMASTLHRGLEDVSGN